MSQSQNLNLRTIFGIKLKRSREGQGLTLAQLSERAQVSPSYLAEIEAGKKYPKADKILHLSQALGCSYDELISSKLDQEFDALQKFLDSPGVRDFPFEMFGVPADELVKLLTKAPTEVAALLRALNEVADQYNIGVEHFLHASLRSYQELTSNHYADLETAAETFRDELGEGPVGKALRGWTAREGVEIDERGLGEHPALLEFRGVMRERPRRTLLLNPQLGESQRAFVLAREAGYRILGLRARSQTTPPDREDSFQQVLNDFKASYFAGAVLMPRRRLVPDLTELFALPTWQPRALLGLLDRYAVTAETLMYRMSQLLPAHFGLRPHFLKFNDLGGQPRLVKQLNLSELPVPAGTASEEHYCRRWLSTRLLKRLAERREAAGAAARTPRPICGAQRSRFVGKEAEFFCIGLAQPLALSPEVNSSLTLGVRADGDLPRVVRFAEDKRIPRVLIGSTCEQCPLTPAECEDRAAPPTRYLQRLARADRQRQLRVLLHGD